MKRSITAGLVLLSVLVLSFCVAFAESKTASNDNTTDSLNATDITEEAGNATEAVSASMSDTNVTIPDNGSMNATLSENVTGNSTNPFASAKGSVACMPGCNRVCAAPINGGPQHCFCQCQ